MRPDKPGLVALFGSGETSASAYPVYDRLLRGLTPPIKVAVLETPAGFQPNTAWVAEKVGDFLRQHLHNYQPEVAIVPARRCGTPFSPDEPSIVAPILQSNVIFMGPGSPTYAVRQLKDSLAWHMVMARHRLGASIIFASAATIAVSIYALPVYEIYKAGEELHWQPGLDFFSPYGLSLVFVSHWNNHEGGIHLDTSRCYMGQARFEQLLRILPSEATVVGIDEHTAVVIDIAAGTCSVMGRGKVSVIKRKTEQRFVRGQTFDITELGHFQVIEPQTDIPPEVWEQACAAQSEMEKEAARQLPSEVLNLVEEREAARRRSDWSSADALRERIASMGWQVKDTPGGPELAPVHHTKAYPK